MSKKAKLTDIGNAPWEDCIDGWTVRDADGNKVCETYHGDSDVEKQVARQQFIALSRNAFDVMMRREGWYPYPIGGEWSVRVRGLGGTVHHMPFDSMQWPDPFTALDETDKWYSENVERKKTQYD